MPHRSGLISILKVSRIVPQNGSIENMIHEIDIKMSVYPNRRIVINIVTKAW